MTIACWVRNWVLNDALTVFVFLFWCFEFDVWSLGSNLVFSGVGLSVDWIKMYPIGLFVEQWRFRILMISLCVRVSILGILAACSGRGI